MLLTLEKVSASTRAIAETEGTESTSADPDRRPAVWLAMVPPVAMTRTRGGAPAASGHAQATAMNAPDTRRARVVASGVTARLWTDRWCRRPVRQR